MNEPIVSVRDLTIRYRTRESALYATENVSFDLRRGEILSLVGGERLRQDDSRDVDTPAPLPGEQMCCPEVSRSRGKTCSRSMSGSCGPSAAGGSR